MSDKNQEYEEYKQKLLDYYMKDKHNMSDILDKQDLEREADIHLNDVVEERPGSEKIAGRFIAGAVYGLLLLGVSTACFEGTFDSDAFVAIFFFFVIIIGIIIAMEVHFSKPITLKEKAQKEALKEYEPYFKSRKK